ncbi:malate dehydrogenase [Gloeobacter morelensis]|uniref:Malate dehydrogenase n=1 Tax=Gloeobacter morelensis MG652769 TaxID=2781736 RepID=A0ABY3PLJ8_9CYAN|nr:malate dehydrogenase [Gloeobacter morelensis]UFP94538.1 malate dehydrogenase [Gloeobacter morelensis MG652769]
MAARSCRESKVSILGAGNVGTALAQRLIQGNLADVVLLDIVEGRPQGLALDLLEACGVEGRTCRITGTNDYARTAGSDVLVVAAGFARQPGMSRDDLLLTNTRIVFEVTQKAVTHSPEATVVVITNPLDAMSHVAWRASGLVPERVMGMAGVLDAARFETFIAWELGFSVRDIRAMVLGGHGDLMVPLPRYTTISGVPLTQLLSAARIDALIERTRTGGAEIVHLLKRGGAYYAPAAAAARMIETLLGDERRLLPVAAYLSGEYGLRDIHMGVPVILGRHGVERVVELTLETEEKAALCRSAHTIRASLDQIAHLMPANQPPSAV